MSPLQFPPLPEPSPPSPKKKTTKNEPKTVKNDQRGRKIKNTEKTSKKGIFLDFLIEN
jgi:hypothetical protein